MHSCTLLGLLTCCGAVLCCVRLATQPKEQGPGDEILTMDVCPWTPGHPRHDHQLIFPLKDGRLLLVWSEYYVNRPSQITSKRYAVIVGDEMPCRISARLSADRGRTWSETFTLQENVGARNVKHPNLLRLPSGEVLFFYTVWNSNRERLICMKRSKDDCETWSEPVKVSLLGGFNNINNDHVLRMSSGRIMLPSFNSEFYGKGDHWKAFCYWSDDEGRTWQVSETKMDLPARGAEEPGIVELKDGSLLAVLRTSLGSVYRAYSHDGGRNWTTPESTGLAAPASPPLIKRIPSTGDLLLVWNRNYQPGHHHQGERTPLTAAISRDEGKSWENIKDIERVPGGSAAYAAVFFQDQEALVTYYYQPKGMGGASGVRLKIIPVGWFYK